MAQATVIARTIRLFSFLAIHHSNSLTILGVVAVADTRAERRGCHSNGATAGGCVGVLCPRIVRHSCPPAWPATHPGPLAGVGRLQRMECSHGPQGRWAHARRNGRRRRWPVPGVQPPHGGLRSGRFAGGSGPRRWRIIPTRVRARCRSCRVRCVVDTRTRNDLGKPYPEDLASLCRYGLYLGCLAVTVVGLLRLRRPHFRAQLPLAKQLQVRLLQALAAAALAYVGAKALLFAGVQAEWPGFSAEASWRILLLFLLGLTVLLWLALAPPDAWLRLALRIEVAEAHAFATTFALQTKDDLVAGRNLSRRSSRIMLCEQVARALGFSFDEMARLRLAAVLTGYRIRPTGVGCHPRGLPAGFGPQRRRGRERGGALGGVPDCLGPGRRAAGSGRVSCSAAARSRSSSTQDSGLLPGDGGFVGSGR